MFPPLKNIHTNVGYQMDSLKAAVGNPRSIARRARKLKKSVKKRLSLRSSWGSEDGTDSGSPPEPLPPPPQLSDREALAAYIMEQVALMQSQRQQRRFSETTGSSGDGALLPGGVGSSLANLYTSFLPNYMYFQPVAAEGTENMIRPTSLCSGTGITGDQQYLQPEMLGVFSAFGSYLIGSGHLFEEEEEAGSGGGGGGGGAKSKKRRAAFWVETIHERDNEDEADDSVFGGDGASSDGSGSDGSDCASSSNGSVSSDSCGVQKEFIERVIDDLRRSQMMAEQPNSNSPRVMSDYEIRDK